RSVSPLIEEVRTGELRRLEAALQVGEMTPGAVRFIRRAAGIGLGSGEGRGLGCGRLRGRSADRQSGDDERDGSERRTRQSNHLQPLRGGAILQPSPGGGRRSEAGRYGCTKAMRKTSQGPGDAPLTLTAPPPPPAAETYHDAPAARSRISEPGKMPPS